eukprot:8542812-Lingulodinium_polyedra.AAC.1
MAPSERLRLHLFGHPACRVLGSVRRAPQASFVRFSSVSAPRAVCLHSMSPKVRGVPQVRKVSPR